MFRKFTQLLCGVMLLGTLAFGQASYTTTTLGAAVTSSQTTLTVASTTGITGSVGGNGWGVYVDKEYIRVSAVDNSTTLEVIRGQSGTKATAHISGAIAWAGPANYFTTSPKEGSCTAANEVVNPVVNTTNGEVYDCDSSIGAWVVQREFFVPANFCGVHVSGTGGTNNNSIILDGSVSALLAITTAATSHDIFTCEINVPARLDSIRGAKITAISFIYSQQGTATGLSEVAPTLGSFTAPAAKTSETASSATLVAAGGTLTVVPAVASANLVAVSAGQYYSEKITLATPVNLSANPLQTLVLAVEFDQSGSTVTDITTPGFWVYYSEPSPVSQVLD